MQQNRALLLLFLLTGIAGYPVFGWMGAMGVFLAMGLLVVGRYRKLRRNGGAPEDAPVHPDGRHRRCAPALRRRARLEGLLAKAQLMIGEHRDVYGARNCCLEIIGQTEREDPLFQAAFDLYMHTVGGRSTRAAMQTPCDAKRLPEGGDRNASPLEDNVIPFPLADTRR